MRRNGRLQSSGRFWHTGAEPWKGTLQGGAKVADNPNKVSIFQVLTSVMSSFLGVQNNATRERDFKHGRARDFIIVGILLTVVFILVVWGVVQMVMRVATGG